MIHKLCVHPGKLKWFTYSHHLFEKDSIFFQPSTFMTFGVPAVNFQVLDSGWNILGMKPATGIQHLLPTFALWTKGGGRAVPILLKICTGRKTWRHSNFDRSKLQQNVCVFFFVVVVLIGDWGGRVFFFKYHEKCRWDQLICSSFQFVGRGIPTTQKAASSTSRDLTNLAWSKWQNAATLCVDVCL